MTRRRPLKTRPSPRSIVRAPRPVPPSPPEPPQTGAAVALTIRAEGALIVVVDGLRGRVSRFSRAGLGTLALVAFTGLDGGAVGRHAGVEGKHREAALGWVRAQRGWA